MEKIFFILRRAVLARPFIFVLLLAAPLAFSRGALGAPCCHMPPADPAAMERYSAIIRTIYGEAGPAAWDPSRLSSAPGVPGASRAAAAARDSRGAASVSAPSVSAGAQRNAAGPSRAFTESRPYEQLRPALGTHRTLALLVDFDDRPRGDLPAKYRAKEYYEDLLFDPERRSLARYYNEVSKGRLTFSGSVARASASSGTGAHWYRSQKSYGYWGADPDAFESVDSGDIASLAEEAIRNAAGFTDFSAYDSDRDGVVSPYELHLIIFHAGRGQELTGKASDIWSHRYRLPIPVSTRGVLISDYILIACDSPLGVACHEVGHDLGLFDAYDTFTGRSVLGSWSLMDRGAWNGTFPRLPGETPSYPSAYERSMLGWIKPLAVANAPGDYELLSASSASSGTEALKIEVPGTDGREYLLFENRYKTPSSFDDDIPPLLSRDNGVVAYHVDERMPDRTYYGYANDSRNSAFRVEVVQPLAGDVESAYYPVEFSRFTSKLAKFNDGSQNSVRLGVSGTGALRTVSVGTPFAYLSDYEVVIGADRTHAAAGLENDEVSVRATFGHFNPGMTKLSAYLSREVVSSRAVPRFVDESALLVSAPVFSEKFTASVRLDRRAFLDGANFAARFVLEDGGYKKELVTAKFAVKGVAERYLRLVPAEINAGEVEADVVYSEFVNYPEDTESVTISYRAADGSVVSRQADFGGLRTVSYNYSIRISRRYSFRVGDDAASDVAVTVVPTGGGRAFSSEVKLLRTPPAITHGVHSSVIDPSTLNFTLSSDRRLAQAQVYVSEDGVAGTSAVTMNRRSGGPGELYYLAYRLSGSGAVRYRIDCVDRAGNVASTSPSGQPHQIERLVPGASPSRLALPSGVSASAAAPASSAVPAAAFISLCETGGRPVLALMPQDHAVAGPGVLVSLSGAVPSGSPPPVLRSASGTVVRAGSDGRYAIERFGEYSVETAAAISNNDDRFVAVPSPARALVSFVPASGSLALWPATLTVRDSSGDEAMRVDQYSGGPVPVAGFSAGVMFFELEFDGGRRSRGKFAVVR